MAPLNTQGNYGDMPNPVHASQGRDSTMPVEALWHIEERVVPIFDMMHAYVWEDKEPMALNVKQERQLWLVWRSGGDWPTLPQVYDAIDVALNRGYREQEVYLLNTKLARGRIRGVEIV